mgnify:CR=1 FL=1
MSPSEFKVLEEDKFKLIFSLSFRDAKGYGIPDEDGTRLKVVSDVKPEPFKVSTLFFD